MSVVSNFYMDRSRLGFLVDRLWQYRHYFGPASFIIPLLALPLPALAFQRRLDTLFKPLVSDYISGIEDVATKIPKDAVIWTSWSLGYPLLYYTQRPVLSDGGSVGSRRLVYQNLPLASSDPRLSANFMQFYVGHGMKGTNILYKAMGEDHNAVLKLLSQICATGPQKAPKIIEDVLASGQLKKTEKYQSVDDWLNFFFPSNTPPIYLYLMKDYTQSTFWFRYGTWDVAKKIGINTIYKPYFKVKLVDGFIEAESKLRFDATKGSKFKITVNGITKSYPLTHLLTHTGAKLEVTDYKKEDGLRFEWMQSNGYGAMLSPEIAESLFNRLYLRHTVNPDYFKRITLKTPRYQIWQVLGESVK